MTPWPSSNITVQETQNKNANNWPSWKDGSQDEFPSFKFSGENKMRIIDPAEKDGSQVEFFGLQFSIFALQLPKLCKYWYGWFRYGMAIFWEHLKLKI